MNANNKILFCCGDRSADTYLSLLLQSLHTFYPALNSIVLAGERSYKFATKFVCNLVDYDAHGFFSPFFLFLRFIKILKEVKKIIKEGVDAVVLLDYYGFNIQVAKIAKKYNVKVIYYITPQIWATRRYRIKRIKKYVDYVINIYPFEQVLFLVEGINADYFGHPLVDLISEKSENVFNHKIIGLFPGSRRQVIKWNLPKMFEIANYYMKNYTTDIKFVVFGFKKYEKIYNKYIKKIIDKEFQNKIEVNYKETLRTKITLAISVSGTVVLENVFYGIPNIVIYKMPFLMYVLLKKLIYIKNISLPNILTGEEIIPEYIQNNINVKKISQQINRLIEDYKEREEFLENYNKVKKIFLNSKNVSFKVAKKILGCIYGKV